MILNSNYQRYLTITLALSCLACFPSNGRVEDCREYDLVQCVCGTVSALHWNMEWGGGWYSIGMWGAAVHMRGQGRTSTTVSDAEGRFALPTEGQLDGYVLEAQLDDGTFLGSLSVGGRNDGKCEVVDISLRAQSTLRVPVRSDTYPAVILIYEMIDDPTPIVMDGERLDRDDTVQFVGQRPGRYILGAEFEVDGRKQRIYYPGVADKSKAEVIFLGPSALTLPPWDLEAPGQPAGEPKK